MRTTICTLQFKDQKTVTGTVIAKSPQGSYPIAYTGEVARLPRQFATGDGYTLKALFILLSRELGAEFKIEETGNYEVWAE